MTKRITMAAATAGHAEGGTPLNAFDNALLAAGIGNINLVKISSILPPEVPVIELPKIKLGALIPTAYAAMTSEKPGELNRSSLSFKAEVLERGWKRETSVGTRSSAGEGQVERFVLTRGGTESSDRTRISREQRKLESDWLLRTKMQTGEPTKKRKLLRKQGAGGEQLLDSGSQRECTRTRFKRLGGRC